MELNGRREALGADARKLAIKVKEGIDTRLGGALADLVHHWQQRLVRLLLAPAGRARAITGRGGR